MTTRQTIKEALRKCQLFSALNDVELEEITALVTERQYDPGAVIFQQGDPAEALVVLQQGRIALQMGVPEAQQGVFKRMTIDIVTNDEVAGWSALVEPHVYTLTAVCLQSTKVLCIDGPRLKALLDRNPRIGHEVVKRLIQVVAVRLADTRQALLSERTLPTNWNKLGGRQY